MKIFKRAIGMGLLSLIMPATSLSAQPIEYRSPGVSQLPEQVLSASERRFYASAFGALNRQDWDAVRTAIDANPNGILHATLAAEYYLHPNSPRIELPDIEAWLARYADQPQAERMVGLGVKRGITAMPALPRTLATTRQPAISKRTRPRSVNDGTMPSEISSAILASIRDDDPDGARVLLDGIDAALSNAARTEWRQRVAWSYYIENRDTAALAMARTVANGSGPWLAEGAWVEGLAAWRLNDCPDAADAFTRAAARADNVELRTAAQYWAGRSYTRCRQPEQANQMFQRASRSGETLYGMLSAEQLGLKQPDSFVVQPFSREDWRDLRGQANVRNAIALAEIGRLDLAENAVLHQVRTGRVEHYAPLARLAKTLGLTGAQKWIGYNTPRGAEPVLALALPDDSGAPSARLDRRSLAGLCSCFAGKRFSPARS